MCVHPQNVENQCFCLSVFVEPKNAFDPAARIFFLFLIPTTLDNKFVTRME